MKNKIFFLNLKSYLLFEILIKTIRRMYEYSYEATVYFCVYLKAITLAMTRCCQQFCLVLWPLEIVSA